jgi:ribonuclease Z
MLRVTFLGTASSRPTVRRNVSALVVQREGRCLLFDCGEGTQRQMMRYGVGFSVEEIFVTHMHADHYLGITGLLRTMSLQGRDRELVVWGPPEGRELLDHLVALGGERLDFPVHIRELPPGEVVSYGDFRIEAFKTEHTRESIGLALIEKDRLGRFDVETARRLGVEEGPLYGRLHAGEPVQLADGTTVTPEEVVGPRRSGRKLIYTGDTRPSDTTTRISQSADLLIHEATFDERERARARETGHSTARQAAEVARRAAARRLVLTHLSARYADQPQVLLEEAQSVFPDCVVAKDGYVTEIAFSEEPVGGRGNGS